MFNEFPFDSPENIENHFLPTNMHTNICLHERVGIRGKEMLGFLGDQKGTLEKKKSEKESKKQETNKIFVNKFSSRQSVQEWTK